MQGTQAPPLIWELRSHTRATKPKCHNCWTHHPQLLKPASPRAQAPQQKATGTRRPPTAARVVPTLHNWRKPSCSNKDPAQPKWTVILKRKRDVFEKFWKGFTNECESRFFHQRGASQMNCHWTQFICMSIKNYLHGYLLWGYKIAQRPWNGKNPVQSESVNPGALLVVQWLRICLAMLKDRDSIPGLGRSHMPRTEQQSSFTTTREHWGQEQRPTQHSQKKRIS